MRAFTAAALQLAPCPGPLTPASVDDNLDRCIGTIERGPFYAVPIVLGDMGTKGGLKADARARVLDTGGVPIGGLYAAGNASGSITGNCYPGAGGTIGPAMTFGFIAANTIAESAHNAG